MTFRVMEANVKEDVFNTFQISYAIELGKGIAGPRRFRCVNGGSKYISNCANCLLISFV